MQIAQCFHGLDSKGDSGFIASSHGFRDADFWVIGAMVRMPRLDLPYDGTLAVYPLDGDRLAVQCMFEDRDQHGRRWPFCHILVFSRDEYIKAGANPFSLRRAGVFQRQSQQDVACLSLDEDGSGDLSPRSDWSLFPPAGWGALLSALRAPARSYAFLERDHFKRRDEVMETLLSALMPEQRADCFFCTTLWSLTEKTDVDLRSERAKGVLACPPEYYTSGLYLVSAELEDFCVPAGQGYVEPGREENVANGVSPDPLAQDLENRLDQGADPSEIIRFLRQPGAEQIPRESVDLVIELMKRFDYPLTIQEMEDVRHKLLEAGCPEPLFSEKLKSQMMELVRDLDAVGDLTSMKQLAKRMVDAGLRAPLEERLGEWAGIAGGEFHPFFEWYLAQGSLRLPFRESVYKSRMDVLRKRAAKELKPEFAFLLERLEDKDLLVWAREWFSSTSGKREWMDAYGDVLLDHLEKMLKTTLELCKQDQRRSLDKLLELFMKVAHNRHHDEAAHTIGLFWLRQMDAERLTVPGEWPPLFRKEMDRNEGLRQQWVRRVQPYVHSNQGKGVENDFKKYPSLWQTWSAQARKNREGSSNSPIRSQGVVRTPTEQHPKPVYTVYPTDENRGFWHDRWLIVWIIFFLITTMLLTAALIFILIQQGAKSDSRDAWVREQETEKGFHSGRFPSDKMMEHDALGSDVNVLYKDDLGEEEIAEGPDLPFSDGEDPSPSWEIEGGSPEKQPE